MKLAPMDIQQKHFNTQLSGFSKKEVNNFL